MDLDQLLSHRDEINERLLRVMDAAASPWGVKVTRIEIKDILPPADLAGAMARQMKAEREKRASVLEAEGARQAQILRAEGEKQSQILAAEGRKEAAFRDAEARERSAEAEAKATAMVGEAIGRGDLAAANFLVAEKYVEALRTIGTAPNQKVVIVPLEAAALAGTLGGIAEITKLVFGDGAATGANGAGRRQASLPPQSRET
jgi:regulator of protease activity HflC (stomatin/prohibitin superfamily)